MQLTSPASPRALEPLGYSKFQADALATALVFLSLPPSLKSILFSGPEVKGTHPSAGPGSPQPGLRFHSCLYLPQLL